MKRVREPSEAALQEAADALGMWLAAKGKPLAVDLVPGASRILRAALSAVDLVDAREAEAEVERLRGALREAIEAMETMDRILYDEFGGESDPVIERARVALSQQEGG